MGHGTVVGVPAAAAPHGKGRWPALPTGLEQTPLQEGTWEDIYQTEARHEGGGDHRGLWVKSGWKPLIFPNPLILPEDHSGERAAPGPVVTQKRSGPSLRSPATDICSRWSKGT